MCTICSFYGKLVGRKLSSSGAIIGNLGGVHHRGLLLVLGCGIATCTSYTHYNFIYRYN